MIDRDRVIVGFSRLRQTRWRDKIDWVIRQTGLASDPGSEPTRIAAYDLGSARLLWEIDLEEYGLHAVFSIHPAGETHRGDATPGRSAG